MDEPKQRAAWHGIDQSIIDNATVEWHGRLRVCVRAKNGLQATIVAIFSHITREVSVFVKSNVTQFLDNFFDYLKFELLTFAR